MNNLPNNIDKIIARILSGEAQVDDILIFNNWLNEKEEHWQEFLYLKSFWEADSDTTNSHYPEIVYEKYVQKALNHSSKHSKNKRLICFISVAASVLILLGLSTFYRISQHNPPLEYYTYLSSEGVSEFDLNDGTHVKLNKNSKLTYTSNYGKEERAVQLEGEAYFDVTKNPEQVFKVSMENSTIEVLGTKFNVQAYRENQEIVATLDEGKIRFHSNNQEVTLDPHQQLVYDKQTCKMDVQKVETELFTAWKDKLYRYHSIAMQDLVKELKKIYGVEIILPGRLENVKVSGSFIYGQPIEDVLEIMQKSLTFDWENQNEKIIIR